MLAIQPPTNQTKPKTLTANILPCRIHNDGPVDVSSRYWKPIADGEDEDMTSTAYFRGRKLKGRHVHVPEGYCGVVVNQSDKTLESESGKQNQKQKQNGARWDRDGSGHDDDDENPADDEEDSTPVSILEVQGTFSDMIVWDHEKVPESDDVFVKGIHEWIGFANAIHTDEDIPEKQNGTNGNGDVDAK